MLEKDIEQKVVKLVKSRGGRCYKWVSPGERGVPDRICLFPGGRILFLELKKPGGRLSARQKKVIAILRNLGFQAEVIYNFEEFERIIYEI